MPERKLIDRDQALVFKSDNGATYQLKVTNEGTLYFDEVTGAPATDAVAMWKASSYDGTSQFLKDLSGNGHHLKFGSSHPAYVTNGYLVLPGQSGNYASTPDSAAVSITGDIDIRVKVAANDWTPSADQVLLAKLNASGQRSYRLEITATGTLRFVWHATSADTTDNVVSTIAPTITDGDPLWLRFTRSSASGNASFYTSADGSTWNQLGTTVSGIASAIYDGTSAIEIGSQQAGSAKNFAGKVYWAEIRNGIDGPVVAKFDPTSQVDLTTSWTASTGEVWTINSATSTDGSDPLYLPYGGEKYVYLPGVIGNYVSVPDSAALSSTGDIDVRVFVASDDWSTVSGRLISKDAISGPNRSWALSQQTGQFKWEWSADGTTIGNGGSGVSSNPHGLTGSAATWIRVVQDMDNGLGSTNITFYKSTDGIVWTTISSTNVAGTTSIADTPTQVEVGSRGNGQSPYSGKFYRAQIYGSIDGSNKVLDVDFTDTNTTSISGTKFAATAGMVSATGGISIANATFMTNGSTGEQAWHTDTATAGATLVFNLSTAVAMRKVQIYSFGSHPAKFRVDYSDDGTDWTNVPDTQINSLSTGYNPITWPHVGAHSYWRLRLVAATGGAPWLDNVDWLADTGITDHCRPESPTFTATTGQTVTINRSPSDRKVVVVDRPLFLFGGDDYIEAVDSSQLDFDLADSATVVLVLRHHHPNTNEAWLEKESTSGGTTPGWALRGNGSSITYRLGDGTNQSTATQGLPAASSLSVIVGRRNTATDKLQIIRSGVLGTEVTDTLTGSAANNLPLRIGAFSNGAPYMNAEFIGAAIWRRALTDEEIAYLIGEFS